MFVKINCPNPKFPVGKSKCPKCRVFRSHPFRELSQCRVLIGIIHFPFVSSHYKGKVCRRRRRGRCKQVAKRKTKAKRASMPCLALRTNQFDYSSSVSLRIRLILKIMTSNPTVTMTSRTKPNQPSTIADEPTPLFTLPFPMSCAIVLAATDAVCCHSTDTSTNTEETKIRASAAWETGREGKGLTSRSDPVSSISSCQPGNVARRMKQKNARMTATILHEN